MYSLIDLVFLPKKMTFMTLSFWLPLVWLQSLHARLHRKSLGHFQLNSHKTSWVGFTVIPVLSSLLNERPMQPGFPLWQSYLTLNGVSTVIMSVYVCIDIWTYILCIFKKKRNITLTSSSTGQYLTSLFIKC